MTAPTAAGKLTSPEKLERELLARLGLDPSASPEDVAAAHETVSAYLAGAPRNLRSWARAQAAGADEAYALLTDPAALARAVALVGAGARPAVLPGGPATPPAHRDTPAPAAVAVPPAAAARRRLAAAPRYDEDGRRIVSDDEIDALLAEVDPERPPRDRRHGRAARGCHGNAGRSRRRQPRVRAGVRGAASSRSNAFRNLALVGVDRRGDRRRRRRRLRRRRLGPGAIGANASPSAAASAAGPRPGQGRRADGEDPGQPEGRRLPDEPRRRVLQGRRLHDGQRLVHQGDRARADERPRLPGPRRDRLQPGRPGRRREGLERRPWPSTRRTSRPTTTSASST